MEAHFGKRPHPDVVETYWGDELVPRLDEDGEPDGTGVVRVERRGRRPHGREDLSDWGAAMRAGLEAAPAAGDASEGAESSEDDESGDDDSDFDIEDHDDGRIHVSVVRKLVDAQLGTPADGSAELVHVPQEGERDAEAFASDEVAEQDLSAAAEAAAAGGAGRVITAAVSQAAMDEAVRCCALPGPPQTHDLPGVATQIRAVTCRPSPSCGSRATSPRSWMRS